MRPLLTLFLLVTLVQAQEPAKPKPPKAKAYTDPAQTDAGFVIQGEYTGQLEDKTFGVEIWAQGGGKFEAVSYPGGLPGAGWDGDREKVSRTVGGRAEGGASAHFEAKDGSIGQIADPAAQLFGQADLPAAGGLFFHFLPAEALATGFTGSGIGGDCFALLIEPPAIQSTGFPPAGFEFIAEILGL